jgi:putative protease
MKSEYYLATVVNAYRRAIDAYYADGEDYKNNPLFQTELKKTAHRDFTTAYLLGENDRTVNYDDSQSKGTHKFIANVIDYDKDKGVVTVEMRNRFVTGDELEVLSPSDSFNKQIIVPIMYDGKGNEVNDAKLVQQILTFKTDIPLSKGDILRKKV